MQCGGDVRSATVFFVERELFFVILSLFFFIVFRGSSVNLAKISVETSRCKFVCHAQQHIPKCDREEIVSSVETVFQSLEDSPDLRKQMLAISKTA